ncbi:MAG: iron ABC transporter permease [Planctomycetota bacterium]
MMALGSGPWTRLAHLCCLLLFVAAAVLPVGMMAADSFKTPDGISLRPFRVLFENPQNLRLLVRTLLLSAAVAAATGVLGAALGFLLTRTNLPLRRVFGLILVVPLAIPPYINGIGWTEVLPEPFIYSFWGAVFVLTLSYFPIVLLFVQKALRLAAPEVEEAALLCGTRRQVAWHITLPLIFPAVLSGSLIAAMLTASELGVPTLLKVSVFNFEIFTRIGAFNDFQSATILSLPMIGAAVAVLFLEARVTGNMTSELMETAHAEGAIVRLGPWTGAAVLFALLMSAAAFALPIGVLLAKSMSGAAYARALSIAARPLRHSLCLGIVCALVLTATACVLAVLKPRAGWQAKLAWALPLLTFAVPGAIIGLGLLRAYDRPTAPFHVLTASGGLIVCACLGRFLVIPARIVGGSLEQIPNSLPETAAIDGAGAFMCFRHVLFPLVAPALLTSLVICFILCVGEMSAAILVHPPGLETLPIALYTVEANSPSSVVAALSVILVVVTLAPAAALFLGVRPRGAGEKQCL